MAKLKFNAKDTVLDQNVIFVCDKFDAISSKTGNHFYCLKAVCLNDDQNGTMLRDFFCDPAAYQVVTETGYYEVSTSVTGRILAIKPHSFYQI